MTDTTDPVEAVRVRGVVVSRPDVRRLYDSERPIRIDVAGVAFAELTEAEALTIAVALGAVMPDEAAKLRAAADEHAGCAERLGESWAYGDKLETERDQLRSELARVRAEVPDLCDAIEDEANGSFVTRPGPPLDLTAIRNAVNPKSAPTGGTAK